MEVTARESTAPPRQKQQTQPAEEERPPFAGRYMLLASTVALAVVLLMAWGIGAYHFARGHESTDDAFIEGPIVLISSNVNGHVTLVYAQNDDTVKRGQLLCELDQTEYRLKMQQAQSRRNSSMLQEAHLGLAATRVYAPADGRIAHRVVEAGDNVLAGQPLMALVKPQRWVQANFKETQLARISVGQHVDLHIDAYPGQTFSGHVAGVQPGTGAKFSLLPAESASANYVKVVQRIPVRIDFDAPLDASMHIEPGMSVVPVVTVK